ncbi:hypothetical protein GCM10010193_30640 [Kitasatospora atroaurantiaca]|uniref:DNA-directed RNA polymerase specialized sigma24 family protein n=1 Tax=Kitasatospora atroaurantiaca TaxID=285545 RepID=A0A561ER15_9ACTN|nr:DNA-directed RNA polymerase specialized sigma24 family protein [Kitasatospora atroaurantiaca]
MPGSSPTLQAYDSCVDGLFTYCLSVLCEHEAALAAVREVRDLALRHGTRLADPGLLRAWLYSLARYCCLQRLEQGLGTPATPANPAHAEQRHRELASLAWPEAAGTEPEQREALELAVRHRLRPAEVAAVLGLSGEAAQALLAAAGAEVRRTRAALLVLMVGSCPVLGELGGAGAESWLGPPLPDGGQGGRVLGPALRRELVRHVVDCPTCRGTAERVAGELGTGLAGLPGLPVLPAPATLRVGAPPATPVGGSGGSAGAAFLAGAAAGRRAVRPDGPDGQPEPRFDQRGFPRHRAPSQGRALAVRQRVVTTGVLAAVLTAPVVALWGAHRGGDGPGGAAAVSSVRVDAARERIAEPSPAPPAGQTSGGLELAGAVSAETLLPPNQRLNGDGTGASGPSSGAVGRPAPVPAPAAGRLTVEVGEYAGRTVITMTNSGGTTIQWHAVVDADWLRLSRDAGTLAPGQRITVTVVLDEDRAPRHPWTARIALPPSQAVVTLQGGPEHRGGQPPTADPGPSNSPTSSPTPSPTPTPTAPPTASPTASPTAGGGTSPTASPSPRSPTGSPTGSPPGTPTATP